MILTQIAFFVFLHVLGLLVGRLFSRSVPMLFFCCSGYLWGLGAYAVVAALVLAAGAPYTLGTMATLLGGLALVLSVAGAKTPRPSVGDLRAAAASIIVGIGLAAVFASVNISPMSCDSSGQVLMGRGIALYGGFDMELATWPSTDMGWFSNFGSLVPILQSSAVLIGLDYHYALAPLLFCSLLATMFYVFRAALKICNPHHPSPAGHALLGVLFCASSFMFAVQAFYIHNTMPSAAYLILFIATAWLGVVRRQGAYFGLATWAIVVFTLARLEAPIAAVFFLGPLLASRRVSYRQRLLCVFPFVAIVIIWYSRLYSLADPEWTYILTRPRCLLIMGGVTAYGLFVAASRYKWALRLLRGIPEVTPYLMGFVVAGVWLLRPGHMSASTYSLVSNCLLTGSWAALWPVLIVLLLFARFLPRVPEHRLLTQGCLSVFLMMCVLVCFKNPYRLGWGDSGNRMLTELVPILVFYLLLKYGRPPTHQAISEAGPIRRRWLVAALPGIALLMMFAVAGTTWKDYAANAAVLRAPKCAPGYEFDIVFMGATPRFVSAVDRCPSTVVFDIGRCAEADWLDVAQHDAERGFEDYAYQVSTDLNTWTLVYDSRSAQSATVYRVQALTKNMPESLGYPLSACGPFQYVRMTVRRAAGENRILLSRVSVWSSWPKEKLKPSASPQRWTPSQHLAANIHAFAEAGEIDWAIGATTVRGPGFAPGREFDEAVDGRLDDGFAAAAGPGEFVIDLGWEVDASAIEGVEMDPASRLTDFAWHVSTDSIHWVEVGDTRTNPATGAVKDLTTRWAVPQGTKLRFLRLTARDTDPARSLRLQRLSVLQPTTRAQLRQAARAIAVPGAPVDHALGARVLSSPACAPGYELDVALRGCDDGRFVSAVDRCPSTVVIDLEEPISAVLLKLHGHDTLRAFEDYAIHVSMDQTAWTEVFDTQSEAHRRRIPFSDVLTGYDLREAGAFRYVRLVVRSAKQENRILLNRLSIWTEGDPGTWPAAVEPPWVRP